MKLVTKCTKTNLGAEFRHILKQPPIILNNPTSVKIVTEYSAIIKIHSYKNYTK